MALSRDVGLGELEGVGVLLDADEALEGRGEEARDETDPGIKVGSPAAREPRDRVGHEVVEEVEVALEEAPDMEAEGLARDRDFDEALLAFDPDLIAVSEDEEAVLRELRSIVLA